MPPVAGPLVSAVGVVPEKMFWLDGLAVVGLKGGTTKTVALLLEYCTEPELTSVTLRLKYMVLDSVVVNVRFCEVLPLMLVKLTLSVDCIH